MHLLSPVICVCCLASTISSAKLPSIFTKCERKQSDFQQCLTKAIESAIKTMDHPIKEMNLQSLEPLEVSALTIGAGNGPVAFQQNYKNMKVSGFNSVRCSKAEFDSDKKTLMIDCIMPEFRFDFNYEINGKILLLPIFGHGPGLIVLHDTHFVLTFNLAEYEKKGKKYYKIVSQKLDVQPKLIDFKLDNLFNGDKALGDNIIKVMNDNWAELFADVKPSYEEAFGTIFASIFDKILAKVPSSDLFGDE